LVLTNSYAIFQDGDSVCQTKYCLFGMADSMEKIRAFEQVFLVYK
jgi:hypothetical protein